MFKVKYALFSSVIKALKNYNITNVAVNFLNIHLNFIKQKKILSGSEKENNKKK